MPKKSRSSKARVAKTGQIVVAGTPVDKSGQTGVTDSVARAIGALNSERVAFSERIEAYLSWDAEDVLDSRQLADYLLSFTRMYSAARQIREQDVRGTRWEAELLERGLPRPRPMDGLSILRITYASPLEIVVGGIAVGIALAVVLSGGQFEISGKGLKAKLPPIGTGIAALKRALAMMPRKRTFFDDIPFDAPLPVETRKRLRAEDLKRPAGSRSATKRAKRGLNQKPEQ